MIAWIKSAVTTIGPALAILGLAGLLRLAP
jgi:hypothetical protein